jgi:hypothetical protein
LFTGRTGSAPAVDRVRFAAFPPNFADCVMSAEQGESKTAELQDGTCAAKSPPPKRMRIAAFSPDFAGW